MCLVPRRAPLRDGRWDTLVGGSISNPVDFGKSWRSALHCCDKVGGGWKGGGKRFWRQHAIDCEGQKCWTAISAHCLKRLWIHKLKGKLVSVSDFCCASRQRSHTHVTLAFYAKLQTKWRRLLWTEALSRSVCTCFFLACYLIFFVGICHRSKWMPYAEPIRQLLKVGRFQKNHLKLNVYFICKRR